MSAVLSIVAGNLRNRRRASTVLLLLVLMLASAGVCASLIARDQAPSALDRSFEASKGPHLVVYSSPRTDAEVRAFLEQESIDSIVGPIRTFYEGVDYATRQRTTARVIAYDSTQPWPIANPLLRSGRWALTESEIVVDHAFATAKGVRVGQTVNIARNGNTPATVVGTALDFQDCYIPDCNPVRMWMTPTAVAASGSPRDSLFFTRSADPRSSLAQQAALQARFGDTVGSNSWPDTRDDILQRDLAFGSFLRGFGLFVLLASSFVVASALTARTVARRRDIGILKSLGYSSRQISASVLIEHALIGGIAAVAGWLAAGLLTSRLRAGVVRLLEGNSVSLSLTALATTVALIATSLFIATALPAIRWSRASTVSALRDTQTGAGRPSYLSRGLEQTGAPLPAVLGARDLSARPARTLLTIGAVVITVIAAICSVGLVSSMQRLQSNPSLTGAPADVQSSIPAGQTAASFGQSLNGLDEVGAWYTDMQLKSSIGGRPFLARVMGGDPAAAAFQIREGLPLTSAGEAIVGWGFMRTFGVDVGAQIEVLIGTEQVALTIVGWYSETEESGVLLRVREESLPAATRPIPTDVRIVAADSVSRAALRNAISSRFAVRAGTFEPDDSLGEFITATRIMALLISTVAVAHVLSSLMTTARERARDLGVLRSLGFTNFQLTAQAAASAGLMAVAALAVGLPLGWRAQFLLGDTLSREIGAGPGLTVGPALVSVVGVAVAVLVIALAIGAVSARGVLRHRSADLVRVVD